MWTGEGSGRKRHTKNKRKKNDRWRKHQKVHSIPKGHFSQCQRCQWVCGGAGRVGNLILTSLFLRNEKPDYQPSKREGDGEPETGGDCTRFDIVLAENEEQNQISG